MKITFDDSKRLMNIEKHGLDFSELDIDFFDHSTILSAKSGRSLAIGDLKGLIIVAVVFRRLGSEALSVISMRPASRKERNLL